MAKQHPTLTNISHAINMADCIYLTIPRKKRHSANEAKQQLLEALASIADTIKTEPK